VERGCERQCTQPDGEHGEHFQRAVVADGVVADRVGGRVDIGTQGVQHGEHD
jgi:hypothetical protein